MKGCIQKKGDFYYAIVAIQNKRKWFKAGPSQNDAQKILAEKIHEIWANYQIVSGEKGRNG